MNAPRAGARHGPGMAARSALVALLALITVGPVLLLVVSSTATQWFFPALIPPAFTVSGWHGAVGGALAPIVATSVGLGIGTAVIACAVALPIGRSLAQLRGWRRHVGAAAAFLPVASPPLALGTGLQVMALAAGVGGTTAGVLLAHLVPTIGYLSLFFLGTFTLFDTRVEAEARTLGATAAQTWWRVTLPLLRRPITEALAVGFLISWTQFALTLVVGGGAVRTLPLEVFGLVRAGDDRAAAVGALLLVMPALGALGGLRWAARSATVAPA